MPAKVLIVTVAIALVLSAALARAVFGPIAGLQGGAYVSAKIGAVPDRMATGVEMARNELRRARLPGG